MVVARPDLYLASLALKPCGSKDFMSPTTLRAPGTPNLSFWLWSFDIWTLPDSSLFDTVSIPSLFCFEAPPEYPEGGVKRPLVAFFDYDDPLFETFRIGRVNLDSVPVSPVVTWLLFWSTC